VWIGAAIDILTGCQPVARADWSILRRALESAGGQRASAAPGRRVSADKVSAGGLRRESRRLFDPEASTGLLEQASHSAWPRVAALPGGLFSDQAIELLKQGSDAKLLLSKKSLRRENRAAMKMGDED